ncbi:MAG: ABC transporter permease [Solirubrobacterales bacterium]
MTRRRRRTEEAGSLSLLYPKGFWRTAATPGVLWLVILFVIPFYALLSMAGGRLDPVFGNAVPEWNPLRWDRVSFRYVLEQIFSADGIYRVLFVRTLGYVLGAVSLCVLIGYPVAYYLSRSKGRYRGLLLTLIVIPFWISYLMRMLAWVGLLEDDGLLNRVLQGIGILHQPYPWLEGKAVTVIFGLAYGYVPFFILPLFAALERIDDALFEAAWDMGASSPRTFLRVTLPLSKQGMLAGIAIIMLPMFGDFYTAFLLSQGRPQTSMIGNEIQRLLLESTFGYAQARGAALVVMLSVLVSVLTIYYLYATARATREARR